LTLRRHQHVYPRSSVAIHYPHYLPSSPPFFLNPTATPVIYTLSLHDALPISPMRRRVIQSARTIRQLDVKSCLKRAGTSPRRGRSEEHTSELQSHLNLVCRLLLEKKNRNSTN